jgi:hypothetical protein
VEESPDTMGFEACTVKAVELAGVAAVVLIVSVDVLDGSEATKLTVLGLNDAVAPVGNEVVKLRFALKGMPVAPFLLTVTVYVAPPAVP